MPASSTAFTMLPVCRYALSRRYQNQGHPSSFNTIPTKNIHVWLEKLVLVEVVLEELVLVSELEVLVVPHVFDREEQGATPQLPKRMQHTTHFTASEPHGDVQASRGCRAARCGRACGADCVSC